MAGIAWEAGVLAGTGGTVPKLVERGQVIVGRLPGGECPAADLRLVAPAVCSGGTRASDRHRRGPLVDAVAASCSVPDVRPPVTIDGPARLPTSSSSTPTPGRSPPSGGTP